jgi:hypothetical protein
LRSPAHRRGRLELDNIGAISLRAEDHDSIFAGLRHRHFFLPQSSSASRVTAAALGFFILEPIRRAPRAISRVLPLRHDAFEAELAGMGEDGRAVALDMLIELHAGTGAATGPKLER